MFRNTQDFTSIMKLVYGSTVLEFESRILEAIKDGFSIKGKVLLHDGFFYQNLFKKVRK